MPDSLTPTADAAAQEEVATLPHKEPILLTASSDDLTRDNAATTTDPETAIVHVPKNDINTIVRTNENAGIEPSSINDSDLIRTERPAEGFVVSSKRPNVVTPEVFKDRYQKMLAGIQGATDPDASIDAPAAIVPYEPRILDAKEIKKDGEPDPSLINDTPTPPPPSGYHRRDGRQPGRFGPKQDDESVSDYADPGEHKRDDDGPQNSSPKKEDPSYDDDHHLAWYMHSFGLNIDRHRKTHVKRYDHKALHMNLLHAGKTEITHNSVSFKGKQAPPTYFKGATLVVAHQFGGKASVIGQKKSYQIHAKIHEMAYNLAHPDAPIKIRSMYFSPALKAKMEAEAQKYVSMYASAESPYQHKLRRLKEQHELRTLKKEMETLDEAEKAADGKAPEKPTATKKPRHFSRGLNVH